MSSTVLGDNSYFAITYFWIQKHEIDLMFSLYSTIIAVALL
jgi:hypothetical protein